jgi:iron complex outermembrane recepter protein
MYFVKKSSVIQSGNHLRYGLSAAALAAFWAAPAIAQTGPEAPAAETQSVDQPAPQVAEPSPQAGPQEAPPTGNTTTIARQGDRIVVTARRIEEDLQEVPIPVSVVDAEFLSDSGAFNVGRLKEVIPTLQFYSSNARNTAVNIRGLGAPFGLTNDGLDAGVGLYVDGVFWARPGSTAVDFLDIERVEVLRGPQGTLFGKNTTAGAINVTTRKPTFTPETEYELSYGNFGFIQAKATIAGPLTENIAGRLSFSGTQRDGTVYSVSEEGDINDLNNQGVRGQLLFRPSDALEFILSGDYTRQRVHGNVLLPAGVTPTFRAANRQYAFLAAASGNYAPASFDPFQRLSDADSSHQGHQELGGVALNAEWDIGPGTLTAITAYRHWGWKPRNDRDFLGLPITTVSANPSKQDQYTQEIRYAGDVSENLSFVAGAFYFHQEINSTGRQEQGASAGLWLLAPSANNTPALLNGYGQTSRIDSKNTSAALFGQLEWKITDRLRLLPGIRFNYDKKEVEYEAVVYGGIPNPTPAQVTLQRSILAPLAYTVDIDDDNISGQVTASYKFTDKINGYATYATAFKPVGLNLGGIPTDSAGNPILDTAAVDPEDVSHIEIGLKTEPLPGVTANFALFNTEVKDYQAQVFNAVQVGVLRGYLANADKVRVHGFEFDGAADIGDNFSLYAALAWTDGEYEKFVDAPVPLEFTGLTQNGVQVQSIDISGSRLPGISKWAGSIGGEFTNPGSFFGRQGEYFVAADASYRSAFSSSPTPSLYLNVDAYTLINARVGFRADNGWDAFLWARNLADEDYFEQLAAAPGGSGLYAGQVGDPRTAGITLRGNF